MGRIQQLVAVALLAAAGSAGAQEFGETVSLRGTINQDVYSAGGTVINGAVINGDLVIAGGTLIVDGAVQNDVLMAGGDTTVNAHIGDDLRATAGTLVLDADIAGDLVFAGGQLSIAPTTRVGGNAWVAGGKLSIDGTYNGDLRAAGGQVTLAGHILGDVDLEADQLTISDGTRIDGNLNYRSPLELSLPAGVVVKGAVTYTPTEWAEPRQGPSLFFLATMAVTTLAFYLLFKGFTLSAVETIRTEFWKSLGFGFVTLVVVPFLAIFAMSIVIGLWLGLILIALYLTMLVIGSVLGMVCTGDYLARLARFELSSTLRRVLSILVAFVALGLIQLIPYLGGLTTFVVLLVGLGAITINLYRRYATSA